MILPNGTENLKSADHVAAELRRTSRRVGIIPTLAQVQGLAAMAVHEPSADFESVVVAMSSAAGHARHGAVTVAEKSAMTMAGRCQPGECSRRRRRRVVIGTSVAEVAWQVVERLLAAGGELRRGSRSGAADDSARRAARVRERSEHPSMSRVVDGQQPRDRCCSGWNDHAETRRFTLADRRFNGWGTVWRRSSAPRPPSSSSR